MKREWKIALLSFIIFLLLYIWLHKRWLSDVTLNYGDSIEIPSSVKPYTVAIPYHQEPGIDY